MNKKLLSLLGLTFLINMLSGCAQDPSDLSLNNASDNYIMYNGVYTEYGKCSDGWDNDGDGLKDEQDPDCHNPRLVNDLSLVPFLNNCNAVGHNFCPDLSKSNIGYTGYDVASFRNASHIASMTGALTNNYGLTAGAMPIGYGVDPLKQPLPADVDHTFVKGNRHPGNNGDIFSGISYPALKGLSTINSSPMVNKNSIESVKSKLLLNNKRAVAPVVDPNVYTIPGLTESLYKGGSQGATTFPF